MLPSLKPAALAVLFLSLAFNANLVAQQQPAGDQEAPVAKEPADTSAQDAISHGVAAFK
jgi:hypothetical protein